MIPQITMKSNAKINLGLWIISQLPNQYHELQTVFMQIDWHDTLTFTLTHTPQMTITHEMHTRLNTENNLCIQAAHLLQNKLGMSRCVSIHLHKRIPMGAGLGGGSSNAATTLIALNHLFQSNLSISELAKLGAKLGADVPFFIYNIPLAIAEGIGDIITPSQSRFPYSVVTAFPNEHVVTTEAYQHLKLQLPKQKQSRELLQSFCKGENLQLLKNDFESTVLEKFPRIKTLKNEFLHLGALAALMSGSGSAVFGIFENKNRAVQCYDTLRKNYTCNFTPPTLLH